MSVARYGCAAVCIEGNVYVVGGLDGETKHASVECYDPVANEWRTLPSMSAARCYCAAAVGEIPYTTRQTPYTVHRTLCTIQLVRARPYPCVRPISPTAAAQ